MGRARPSFVDWRVTAWLFSIGSQTTLNLWPNKLFEYMYAGIAVSSSNFPFWREIAKQASCGLLVKPLERKAIAQAVEYLPAHPEKPVAMGRRRHESVERRYN